MDPTSAPAAAQPLRAPHGLARIHKTPRPGAPAPHLADPAAERARFTWDQARAWLDGLPGTDGTPGGGGLNIAHEAVDRHLQHGRGPRTALRWLGKGGARRPRPRASPRR
jgi:acetyl-CoA synthetase